MLVCFACNHTSSLFSSPAPTLHSSSQWLWSLWDIVIDRMSITKEAAPEIQMKNHEVTQVFNFRRVLIGISAQLYHVHTVCMCVCFPAKPTQTPL